MTDQGPRSTEPNTDLPATGEIDEALREGKITGEQAAEQLQQAARRQTAEQGPALDTDEDGLITNSGFGAGQGMAKHSTNRRGE